MKKNKKNVLVLIDSRGVGGVEKRFSYLYKYLALQHELDQNFYFLINKNLMKKIQGYNSVISNNNISLINFGVEEKKYLTLIMRLIEYFSIFVKLIKLRKINFQSGLFVTTRSLSFRKLINSKKKISIIYTAVPQRIINTQRFKNITRDGFLLDCLSENISQEIRNSNFVPNNQIFTSPNSFIDYEGTNFIWEEKQNEVSFCSRFDQDKGIELILEVIEEYYNRNYSNNFSFRLIGYGPLKQIIEKKIQQLNLDELVSVHYAESPVKYLIKSKIFLSLQSKENYPSQALIEAMACGNAIIATDVGLTRRIVTDDAGFLVNKNASEIVEKINDLIKDPKILQKKAINASKFVRAKHTVENYLDYLNKII